MSDENIEQDNNSQETDLDQTELIKSFESKMEKEREKFLSIIADYENKMKRQQIDSKNEREKFLSIIADYDNKMKRLQIDSKNFIQQSIEKIVLDIVPIIEELNFAIKLTNKETQEGINLIIKKIKKILLTNGITEIMPTKGDDFNLELHQAINSKDIDFEKAKIKELIQPGYIYQNKIIQSALVIVE